MAKYCWLKTSDDGWAANDAAADDGMDVMALEADADIASR
jgi:hypothetical protein